MPVPPKQVLVPVTLIQCLVPVIAEPGDHLMLLNGICIGIDTSHQEPPRRGPAGVKAQLALQPPAKPKRKSPKRPDIQGLTREQIHARTTKRMDKILAALATGPMKLAELSAKTGETKSRIQIAVQSLDAQHKLVKPHKRGTGHYRTFELRKPT